MSNLLEQYAMLKYIQAELDFDADACSIQLSNAPDAMQPSLRHAMHAQDQRLTKKKQLFRSHDHLKTPFRV
jgi:hypothetical protein